MAFSSSVPVRYWRIGWGRSVSDTNSYAFEIATLELYDAAGTHLSDPAGATPPTITLSGASTDAYDLVTYPLSNLTDGLSNTHVALYSTGIQLEDPRYIEYDFGVGNEVLLDYFDIASVTDNVQALYDNWIENNNNAGGWDLFVGASADGSEWMLRYWAPKFLQSKATAGTTYTIGGSEVSSINNYGRGQLRAGGSNSTGAIYGIVSEDGTVYPNRPVFLYDDATSTKISNTFTDQYGGYAFSGLDINRVYTVLSRDFSGPPYKNALVYDRIEPVNATSANASPNAFFELRNKDPDIISFFHITQENTNLASTAQKWLDSGKMSTGQIIPDIHTSGSNSLTGPLKFEGSQIKTALGTYANECNFFWFPKYAKNNGVEAVYPDTMDMLSIAMSPDYPSGDRSLGGSGSAFTVELYAQMPETGEDDAYYFWGGAPLDGGAWQGGTEDINGTFFNVPGTIRIGLGGNNDGHGRIQVSFPYGGLTATVRFDTGVSYIPNGNIVHIAVTHLNKQECKLYIDGVLYGTVSLLGTADIYVSVVRDYIGDLSPLNARMTFGYDPNRAEIMVSGVNEPLSHVGSNLSIFGSDIEDPWTSTYGRHAGPGGAFGHAACYGRVFTQAEVTDLYDSIADWSTMYVAPVYGGYSGEVEKDIPVWYYIGNQSTTAGGGLVEPSLLGFRGTPALFGSNAPAALSTPLRGTSDSFGATADMNGFCIQNSTHNMGSWSFECFLEVTQWPSAYADTSLLLYESASFYGPQKYGDWRVAIDGAGTNLVYTYRDVDNATWTPVSSPLPTPFSLNTVYHVCLTFDMQGDMVLYLNGVAQLTVVAPFQWQFGQRASAFVASYIWTDPTVAHGYVLGPEYGANDLYTTYRTQGSSVPGGDWRGRYSDVALYTHVVPAARVLAHYNARNS